MNGITSMAENPYPKATKPTLYFLGITATASSIMRIFPRWAAHLGLGDCEIRGIDLKKPSAPAAYRAFLDHIRDDAHSLGAVVTSHKTDIYATCRDAFDEVDDYARLTEEVSCISKRNGRLVGQAKDPITSGLALEAFLPSNHWPDTKAWALVLGAGGSAIAVTLYLLKPEHGRQRPARLIIANRSALNLEKMERIHRELSVSLPIDYRLAPCPSDNDALVSSLPSHSLVINATGLGKDAPGSPLTDRVIFPDHAMAWDFNARGDLVFLAQARSQAREKAVHAEDGWTYFIHGWTRHIAEIFHADMPTQGPSFDVLKAIAETCRG